MYTPQLKQGIFTGEGSNVVLTIGFTAKDIKLINKTDDILYVSTNTYAPKAFKMTTTATTIETTAFTIAENSVTIPAAICVSGKVFEYTIIG